MTNINANSSPKQIGNFVDEEEMNAPQRKIWSIQSTKLLKVELSKLGDARV